MSHKDQPVWDLAASTTTSEDSAAAATQARQRRLQKPVEQRQLGTFYLFTDKQLWKDQQSGLFFSFYTEITRHSETQYLHMNYYTWLRDIISHLKVYFLIFLYLFIIIKPHWSDGAYNSRGNTAEERQLAAGCSSDCRCFIQEISGASHEIYMKETKNCGFCLRFSG